MAKRYGNRPNHCALTYSNEWTYDSSTGTVKTRRMVTICMPTSKTKCGASDRKKASLSLWGLSNHYRVGSRSLQKLVLGSPAHPRGAAKLPHGYGTNSPSVLDTMESQTEDEAAAGADKRRSTAAGSHRYCPHSSTSPLRSADNIHWRSSNT